MHEGVSTRRLKNRFSLRLVDLRVPIIVAGRETISLAEKGLL